MLISDWSSDVCSSDLPVRCSIGYRGRVHGDYRVSVSARGASDDWNRTHMTIRTILVADEKLATQGLQLRLEAHGDVALVDTAQKGREAHRKNKTHNPDLYFLAITTPRYEGFALTHVLLDIDRH